MDVKKPLFQSHWPNNFQEQTHVENHPKNFQQRSDSLWFNPKYSNLKKVNEPSFEDELHLRNEVQWTTGSEGWSSNSSSSGSFSQSVDEDANSIQWTSGSDAWNSETNGSYSAGMRSVGSVFMNTSLHDGWNSTMMSPIPTTSYVPTVPLEFPKEKSKVKESKMDRTFQNNILLPEVSSSNVEEELSKQDLYKTEMCKSWAESNTCRYGDKCQFAHGEGELRPVFRHPKYKTEICKTFHNYGNCNYGKRCRFVHISPNENSPVKEEVFQPKTEETPPPPPQPQPEKKKEKGSGSKLPFFQKLHKQNKKKVN